MVLCSAMPEFIDPVFTKTSPKRSFTVVQNERFGLVFTKTGSMISGTEGIWNNNKISGNDRLDHHSPLVGLSFFSDLLVQKLY